MPKRRYPGNIARRGNRTRVRLCVGGKYHTFTLPTTDLSIAKRFAIARHRDLERELAQRAAGIRTGVPMSDLLALYASQVLPGYCANTQRSYRDSLKPIRVYFVDQLGDPSVDRIRAADVTAFMTWRRSWRPKGRRTAAPAAPVSNRTIQKDRVVLHAVMALAEQQEFIPANPVARTEAPKADPRSPILLSDDQFESLLAACGERPMLTLYVALLGEAGVRCESEALWLRWEDVELEEGFVTIVSGRGGHRVKSGKTRWVPMTDRLRDAFRCHFARFRFSGSPWVFHHLVVGPQHTRGERIASMRTALDRAIERAKLPAEFHPHDLRHRYVTRLMSVGHSPALIQKAAGHANIRTTLIYTHLAKSDLRALVQPAGTAGIQTSAVAVEKAN